jgi:hypothetical protein
MKRVALCGAVVVLTAHLTLVLAQAPDFSGTWKLDPNRSRVTAEAGLAGLIGSGAPEILHVTQPANGTLVIESQINEGHARLYRPGDKSSTPVFVGPAGSITMTSRWDGRTLVSEGRRETASGTSTSVTEVREVIALSADGRTLTIDVTTAGPGDKSASTLIYMRTQEVGPCQSWPTPCKYPSR